MRLVQVITDYIRRSILTTKGDLVVRGDSLPERLPSGALNTYLRGKGAGQLPAYEAEPTTPACRARIVAAQSIPSGVWTLINLDTVDFDTTSDFNTTTHRWTCSVAGKYLVAINGQISALGDGNRIICAVQRNGAYQGSHESIAIGAALTPAISATDLMSLAVNDYLELWINHNFGANRGLTVNTLYSNYIAIHKLS